MLKFMLVVLFAALKIANFHAQTEQQVKAALANFNSLDYLDSLKNTHETWEIFGEKLFKESSFFDSLLFHSDVGAFLETPNLRTNTTYLNKILAKGKEEVCQVYYIYLDGKKHTKDEMNKLREKIIKKYENGTPFEQLVQEYTEDDNPDGTLRWFSKGLMAPEFQDAVWTRKVGEIFTVNVPTYDWYYVVLKLDENRMVDCTYVVSVKLGEY